MNNQIDQSEEVFIPERIKDIIEQDARPKNSEEWVVGAIVKKNDEEYICLDNGEKYYLKATQLDYLIVLFFPGVGLLLGLFSLLVKKEKKRGSTILLFLILYLGVVLFIVFLFKMLL